MIRCLIVLALTGLVAPVANAQDWAARFPPAPECNFKAPPRVDVDVAGLPAGMGALAVRFMIFGTGERLRHAQGILVPLDSASSPPRSESISDTSGVLAFRGLRAGRYELRVRSIGYSARTDSVIVRAQAVDTITLALREVYGEIQNRYNCRPRRFRYPGESACQDNPDETALALIRARHFAIPEVLQRFPMIPAFDSTDVELVRDEAVCERAAALYGEPGDPPRRVIVVRMDRIFMVTDPFEPIRAGEYHLTRLFDRDWKVIANLLG